MDSYPRSSDTAALSFGPHVSSRCTKYPLVPFYSAEASLKCACEMAIWFKCPLKTTWLQLHCAV